MSLDAFLGVAPAPAPAPALAPAPWDAPPPAEFSDEDDQGGAKMSSNTVRRRITQFLATKEMTQTEIGNVNSNSFGRFMKLKGHSGYDNGTFWGAQSFFLKRDAAAKEQKRVAKLSTPKTERKRKAQDDGNSKAAKKQAFETLLERVHAVDIPRNASGVVPIHDDCDDVRAKGLQFIASECSSCAEFLRACDGINSNSWNKFVSVKGPREGCAIEAYRKAYAFLERVRILRQQPKTPKRLRNEQGTGPAGFSTEAPRKYGWFLA